MIDSEKYEKVIRGLECCADASGGNLCSEECPYHSGCWDYDSSMIGYELHMDALEILRETASPAKEGWVSVASGMPPEWDTMFAKWKGTDKWKDGLFEKMSDDVRVVVELKSGIRKLHHSYTVDGVWACESTKPNCRVLYWMPNPPLPEDK